MSNFQTNFNCFDLVSFTVKKYFEIVQAIELEPLNKKR